MNKDSFKADFIKVFANIPYNFRTNIVVVHNDQLYSWDAVYFEVMSGTELADILLKNLKDLEII